jgi:hypothetical protein
MKTTIHYNHDSDDLTLAMGIKAGSVEKYNQLLATLISDALKGNRHAGKKSYLIEKIVEAADIPEEACYLTMQLILAYAEFRSHPDDEIKSESVPNVIGHRKYVL